MKIIIRNNNTLLYDEFKFKCALGKKGSTSKKIEGELSRRQEIARKTNNGALRLSQINRGDDPKNSWAGVSFRHLALLAQIKSEDSDVWESLRKSGHLEKTPTTALEERLERMRSWINGPHFPEDSKIEIQNVISSARLFVEIRVMIFQVYLPNVVLKPL